MLYPTLKTLHIVSLIAWMAGLFYLPRLFVYHADAPPGSERSETFKTMERRLLKAIMNPAMIATWAFGLWLAWELGAFSQGWLQAKLAFVVLLTGIHHYLARAVKAFAADRNTRSSRHYRIVNELPTLALPIIVALVVFKPF